MSPLLVCRDISIYEKINYNGIILMCGICGVIWRQPSPENVVRGNIVLNAIMDAMHHRGPDSRGIQVTNQAALGHLRLSIIDIEGGAQPMPSPDGRVHISYNGEIYDYKRAMSSQRARGWPFATRSDTETLLAGYILDGEDFDADLNGMYAYAIVDRRPNKNLVQIGLDPVGIKPLFLAETPLGVLFASELRGMAVGLAALGLPCTPDLDAIVQYLTLGWVPAPLTMLEGVRRLEPGTRLQIELGGAKLTSLPSRPMPPAASATLTLDDISTTLDAAVRRQVVSDAPLGFFLSGGIDSSLLVSTAQRIGIKPHTFTVRFTGKGHGVAHADEADVARWVAEHCGAEHHEIAFSAMTLASELDAAFAAMDQPIADPACLPLLVISRFARERVKVCLSGDGGDELFLGYSRHHLAKRKKQWQNLPRPLQASFQRLGAWLPTAPSSGSAEKLRKLRVGIDLISSIDYFAGPFSGRHAAYLNRSPELPIWARDVAAEADALFEADMLGQLAGQMLPKTDHVSMRASLEVRVPFLDHEMISAARAIPMAHKLAGGKGKAPLRAILARDLPPEITSRPKQGFRVPLTSWFREDLAPLVSARLLDVPQTAAGLIERPLVEKLLKEHITGQAEHSVRIWALLALQAWLDSLPRRST